jgi:hypothetical protein
LIASISERILATSLRPRLWTLVRGEGQRRVLLDEVGVKLRAALHVNQPHTLARHRQIFVLQEVSQAHISGADLVADHGCMGGAKPCLVGGRNAFGELLDGSVEGRAFDALRQLQVELIDDVADHELGLNHARLHALPEAGDRPVQQQRILAVAFQIILIILDRLERSRAFARGKVRIECVESEEMVDRADGGQRQHLGVEAAERHFGLALEHVIGEPVGGGKRGAVDARKLAELTFTGGAFRCIISIRDSVAQPVRVAHVAAEQRAQWVAAQIILVALLEERLQPRGCVALRGGGLAASRRGRGGGGRLRFGIGCGAAGKKQGCKRSGFVHRDLSEGSWPA